MNEPCTPPPPPVPELESGASVMVNSPGGTGPRGVRFGSFANVIYDADAQYSGSTQRTEESDDFVHPLAHPSAKRRPMSSRGVAGSPWLQDHSHDYDVSTDAADRSVYHQQSTLTVPSNSTVTRPSSSRTPRRRWNHAGSAAAPQPLSARRALEEFHAISELPPASASQRSPDPSNVSGDQEQKQYQEQVAVPIRQLSPQPQPHLPASLKVRGARSRSFSVDYSGLQVIRESESAEKLLPAWLRKHEEQSKMAYNANTNANDQIEPIANLAAGPDSQDSNLQAHRLARVGMHIPNARTQRSSSIVSDVSESDLYDASTPAAIESNLRDAGRLSMSLDIPRFPSPSNASTCAQETQQEAHAYVGTVAPLQCRTPPLPTKTIDMNSNTPSALDIHRSAPEPFHAAQRPRSVIEVFAAQHQQTEAVASATTPPPYAFHEPLSPIPSESDATSSARCQQSASPPPTSSQYHAMTSALVTTSSTEALLQQQRAKGHRRSHTSPVHSPHRHQHPKIPEPCSPDTSEMDALGDAPIVFQRDSSLRPRRFQTRTTKTPKRKNRHTTKITTRSTSSTSLRGGSPAVASTYDNRTQISPIVELRATAAAIADRVSKPRSKMAKRRAAIQK
jgi:hypothetical protein